MAGRLGTFSGGGLGMGVAFNLFDNYSRNAAVIGKSQDVLANKTERVARRINSSTKMMSTGFKMLASGAVLAAPFAIGVSKSMEFNSTMSEVYAKARVEDKATKDALKATAMELGTTTKFTAKEAAEGMTFLAMAGFNASQQIEAMPGLLSLAAAGNTDLALTSDIVSDAMTAMGLKASDTMMMADQMAAMTTRANTNITQMGEALRYVTATASTAGASWAELNAMLGMMGDIGMKGSIAGTSLNRMLLKLTESVSKQSKLNILKSVGISKEDLVDAEGNLKSLTTVIPLLAKQLKGVGDGSLTEVIGVNAAGEQIKGNVEQLRIARELFGAQGARAFAAFITEGGKDFAEFVSTIENDVGAADAIAEKMLDNLKGDFTRLSSIVDTTLIGIGDSAEGALRPFVQLLTDIVTGFNEFIKTKTGKFVLKLVSGFAALLAGGGALVAIVGALKYAFFSLVPSIWASLAPMLPFIAAIGAVAAGVKLMQRAVTEFSSKSAQELGKEGGLVGWLEKVGGLIQGVRAIWSSWNSETGEFELGVELSQKLQAVGLLESMHNIGSWISRIRFFLKGLGEGFAQVVQGIRGALKKIGEYLNPISSRFEKWGVIVGKNKSAISSWTKTGKALAVTISTIVGAMVALRVATTAARIITIAYRGVMAAVKIATTIATAAQWLYNAALNANPIGVVIMALTALAGVFALVASAIDDTTEEMRIQNEIMNEVNLRYADEMVTLDLLFAKLRNTAEGTKERAAAMDEIVEKYGTYMPGLKKELQTVEGMTRAYNFLAKAIRRKIELQVKEEKLREVVQDIEKLKQERTEGPGFWRKAWASITRDPTMGAAGHIERTTSKINELDAVADKLAWEIANPDTPQSERNVMKWTTGSNDYIGMNAQNNANMSAGGNPVVVENASNNTEVVKTVIVEVDGDEVASKVKEKEELNTKRESWE